MISDILTPELESTIVNTIKSQCSRFRDAKKQEKDLYYEPYAKRRKKYELTAAVLSGFAPDRFSFSNLQVHDLKYGLNGSLYQPELITDTAIIQIYSSGANPHKNMIVQERCRNYNGHSENEKKFLIIKFRADETANLKKVEVILLGETCQLKESKTLYSPVKLMKIPA